MKTIKGKKMKTEKEDLGICVRCEKNKATIQFTEGAMAFAHGFVENICQNCYDKMQKETPLYKKAVKERNAEVKQVIEEWLDDETAGLKKGFDKNTLIFSYNDITEILQKLGLEE